jgi:hypothetical protein
MSDLMMKIGSQLWIVIMLILVLWSGEEGLFPANNVRALLEGDYNAKPSTAPPVLK